MRPIIRAATVLLALLVMTLGQSVLLACGDKFFLVGNGGRFSYAYASLHPGNVLIYTGGTTAISKGLRDARLHRYVKEAGHRVVIAGDLTEFQRALQTGSVDVVLVGLGQAGALVPVAESAASKPTLLPIKGDAADATSAVPFTTTLKSSDKVNKFLSGIESVMKSRKAGARASRS